MSFQNLKLRPNRTFVFIVDEHRVGRDTLYGNWKYQDGMVFLEPELTGWREIIYNSYPSKPCIKFVDKFNSEISGTLFRINDGEKMYQANIKGEFCNEETISMINKLTVYDLSSKEEIDTFYPTNVDKGFTIKIVNTANDFFAKIIWDSLEYRNNKLFPTNSSAGSYYLKKINRYYFYI